MYFIIGIIILIFFILASSGIFLLVPLFTLKLILFAGLGFLCINFFMWMFPECTTAGSRQEIEKDQKNLHESVETVGKSAVFDLFGDYNRNKWLKEQRRKKESGFYEDRNGLKYYNASQDKWYYQLPNGRWQDYDTWNTPIDDPFEKSIWNKITNINEISGFWSGTNIINIPKVKNSNPAFTAVFTMTIKRNKNLIDITFKLDLENYLEVILLENPSYYSSKDEVWNVFIDNGKDQTNSIVYGKYYTSMDEKEVPLESILKDCILLMDNDRARIKATIPRKVFGISGTDNLECILEKQ